MKKQLAAWIVLGIITIVAGFSLAVTNEITKIEILSQIKAADEVARQTVLPLAQSFEPVEFADTGVSSCYAGKKDNETIGYIAQVTRKGYKGNIEVIVGIGLDNKITGISVGGANFAETAGLGAKTRDAKFMDQFIGKTAPLRTIKAGADANESTVDAITSATISSNAVVSAVNTASSFIKTLFPSAETPVVDSGSDSNVFTASAEGFIGPVEVQVTISASGTITALKVGTNDTFAETEGVGSLVKDSGFAAQFIGKALPITISDIDAVSGATYSTQGVVDALNKAYESFLTQSQDAGTSVTASAEGFMGPVEVQVTISASGTITALKVGTNDTFTETEGVGSLVKDSGFAAQFIGKALPITISDIDAVSGATYSTQGVVDALNNAYESFLTQSQAAGTSVTASAEGFMGPVEVQVTISASGTITALKVGTNDTFAETEGVGSLVKDSGFAAQFIGKALPITISDIDAVSGATYSTQGVVDALNNAYKQYVEHGVVPGSTDETPDAATAEPSLARTYSASKRGYMGPISVQLQFSKLGEIVSLAIGDNATFKETADLGAHVKEAAFAEQFIGKIPPVSIADIDAVSGATISSQSVVDAVNLAYTKFLRDQ